MNKPLRKFKAGGLSATIWENISQKEGQSIVFNTVSFERSFKDKEGNWKSTSSLRVNDLPKASLVLQKAYEFIVLKELDSNISEEDVL